LEKNLSVFAEICKRKMKNGTNTKENANL